MPEDATTEDTLARLNAALDGRYVVERELGRGGMATVFVARDLKHARSVAIKVLRPELASVLGPDRFLQEIEIAANLVHPHILPLHDSGDADGMLYYVMPYVEGESLRARLDREGQLPVDEALKIVGQVLSALSHAHSRGIVHRDIKPENILLSAGEAVVADFGIARAIGAAGTRLTQVGMSLGTPAYMSPEQVVGDQEVDARSDVYSVGCMLHEMLTGEPPFAGTPDVVFERHLTAEPRPAGQLRRTVAPDVEAALLKSLQKAPADRYATAAAFGEAIVAGTAAHALPRRRPVTRALPMTAGGLLVAALAGGAFMLTPSAEVPFEAREWIVITGFTNRTGDSVFDGTLDAALTSSIAQSKRVNVFPYARVRETLGRMGRTDTTHIDQVLGTEIALREGAAAVLVPSIVRIDDRYALSARIVSPADGVDLASATVTAEGRDEVLTAVDKLGRTVRRQLGETRFDLVRDGGWVARATTPSLEALKAFTEGARAWDAGRLEEAREHWLQATTYDSTFAWAYASLGLAAYWYNNRPQGEEYFQIAEAHLDDLTSREALWIRSLIAGSRGNRESSIALLQRYLRDYPDDRDAWFNLGSGYMRERRCDEAQDALEEALRIDSTLTNAYIQIATCLNATDRPADAIPFYQEAFRQDSGVIVQGFVNQEYGVTLLKAGRQQEADSVYRLMLDGERWQQARGRRSLALLAMLGGRYAEATELLREAVRINIVDDSPLSQFRNRLYLANALRMRGDVAGFDRELAGATDLHVAASLYLEPYFLMLAGRLHARRGNAALATSLLHTLDSTRGDSDADQASFELLGGEVALLQGDTARAVELLEVAATRTDGAYYLESLARAYALSGDTARAIAAYEQVAGKQSLGAEGQEPWVMAHYELGVLYEAAGEYAKAVAAYQRFVDLWGDGDPDLVRSAADVERRIETIRRAHGIG